MRPRIPTNQLRKPPVDLEEDVRELPVFLAQMPVARSPLEVPLVHALDSSNISHFFWQEVVE